MEWVKPKALLEAMARGNGSTSGLIEGVIKRAAIGAIRAKAQHLTQDDATSFDADVPKQLWSVGSRQLKANWATGDFSASVAMDTSRPLSRDRYRHVWIEALGVTFAKEDAIAVGAVFDDNLAHTAIGTFHVREVETLEQWAARVADCGLKIKGFTRAILKASWRGPDDQVPLVKTAQSALLAELKSRGEGVPGRQPPKVGK